MSFFPPLEHAASTWGTSAPSIIIVFLTLAGSLAVSRAVYERHAFEGLTQRSRLARWSYAFVWNKYYLDVLYERFIVAGLCGPIARGAYWFNQNVLDGIANGIGTGSVAGSRFIYRYIDQKGIDGAVNGIGTVSEGSGGALQNVQSGKVHQYAALLFGAAAIGALILVITVNGS